MDWILGFPVAKSARDELLSILTTEMALKQLRSIGMNLPDGKGVADASNVPLLHSLYQFQYVRVGYDGKMDDLYGSLGRFSLNAAILEWTITRGSGSAGRIMNVSKVGIYMRDTFDFIGEQYLGHWNENGMGVVSAAALQNKLADKEWHWSGWNPSLGWMVPINNSDFNAWRRENNRGGDLLVFSDIQRRAVSMNIPC